MNGYDDLKFEYDANEDIIDEESRKLKKSVKFNDSHIFYDDETRHSDYDDYDEEKDEDDEDDYTNKDSTKFEEVDYNENQSTKRLSGENHSFDENFSNNDDNDSLQNDNLIYRNDEEASFDLDRDSETKSRNNDVGFEENENRFVDEEERRSSIGLMKQKFENNDFNDSNVIGKAHERNKVNRLKETPKKAIILEKRKDLRSNEFDLHYTQNDALKDWVKSKDAEIRRLKKKEKIKRKKLSEERKQRKKDQEKRRQEAQLEFERWQIVKNKELQENKRDMLKPKLSASLQKSSFDETSSHISQTFSDKFVERKRFNNLKAASSQNSNKSGILNKRYSSDPNIHKPNTPNSIDGKFDTLTKKKKVPTATLR